MTKVRSAIIPIIILINFTLFISCSKEVEESSQTKKENVSIPIAGQQKQEKRYTAYSLGNKNAKVMVFEGKYLWIGTSHGLIKYDTTTINSFEQFDNKNGLLSNGIFSITIDKEGNKWIGTYGGGLSVYNGREWKNYNVPNGLCDAFVYDVLFAKDDSIWVATWSGANRIKGDISKRRSWERFTVENTNNQLGDNWVYSLDEDKNGNIWLGTEVGISSFDNKGNWRKWDHKHGLGAPLEIVLEANKNMVAALEGSHHAGQQASIGLLRSNIGNYNPNYVVSMLMDSKEMLWIGTWGGGLSSFDGNRFKTYTVKDGLLGNYILSLAEDPAGNIWIGSNAGLSKFDGNSNTFTNYTKRDGLYSDYVFSIAFAPDGTLWTGGWGGISHIYTF